MSKSKDEESTQGLLFRLGARAGLLVFVGVIVLAVQRGMDPALALVRALVALLVVVACGWVAERIAGANHQPAVAEPPEAPDGEAATGNGDEAETRPVTA